MFEYIHYIDITRASCRLTRMFIQHIDQVNSNGNTKVLYQWSFKSMISWYPSQRVSNAQKISMPFRHHVKRILHCLADYDEWMSFMIWWYFGGLNDEIRFKIRHTPPSKSLASHRRHASSGYVLSSIIRNWNYFVIITSKMYMNCVFGANLGVIR